MGWAGGSSIFKVIIEQAIKHVPDGKRKEFYRPIYREFLDGDWDTENECFELDPEFTELMHDIYPAIFDSEQHYEECLERACEKISSRC